MPFVYTRKQRLLKLIPDIQDYGLTQCIPEDIFFWHVMLSPWVKGFALFEQTVVLAIFSAGEFCLDFVSLGDKGTEVF
jgi:hypothetical protein